MVAMVVVVVFALWARISTFLIARMPGRIATHELDGARAFGAHIEHVELLLHVLVMGALRP